MDTMVSFGVPRWRELRNRFVLQCMASATRSDGQMFVAWGELDGVFTGDAKRCVEEKIRQQLESYAQPGCYCRILKRKSNRFPQGYTTESIRCLHHSKSFPL